MSAARPVRRPLPDPGHPSRRRRSPLRRVLAATGALVLLGTVLAGCDGGSDPGGSAAGDGTGSSAEGRSAPEPRLRANVARGGTDVPVDTRVRVRVEDGTLERVRLTSAEGEVPGEIDAGKATFTAGSLLEPGTGYRLRTVARDADGERVTETRRFTTRALSLAAQTYPSVAPLDGETVGVGMPVVVTFDVPVTDRAAFERHMRVTSTPAQRGSWHWFSDREARWRPARYWQPGTTVDVDVDVNSVPAGGGVYGQESRSLSFRVGDAHIYRVDARTHRMRVYSNGELLRDLPITTGKEGFTTRSGTKVIMEKSERRRMNSETVGIRAGSADAYDIANVQWAMRVTTSGEFIHAAPWSVGSQGRANVSHGCTGMSTEDAGWLYQMTRRGDVVEYTGTDRPMTLENGWGDWNARFGEYRKGSALS